jgi:tetratricopeptide (TPR) repeat protein
MLALSMITRGDEGSKLKTCLDSVAKYVDKIFITITTEDKGAKEVAESFGAETRLVPGKFHRTINRETIDWCKKFFGWDTLLKEGDRIFEFDKARNYSFDLASDEYDFMLWLDSDDIVETPQKLQEIYKYAKENGVDSIFLDYLYKVEVNEHGEITNVLIRHLRERVVRRGVYKWVAPIHETLVPSRDVKNVEFPECRVIHLSDDRRMVDAIYRNIKSLEMNIFDNKGKDPRTLYYLAKTYYDLAMLENAEQNLKKAIQLFNVYIFGDKLVAGTNASGWNEERAQCWDYMSEAYRRMGDLNNSLSASMNALLENPYFPTSYLAIAMSYAQKQDWDRAMHWVKIALQVPEPKSTLVGNPKDEAKRANEIIYHATLNRNRIKIAHEAATKLLEMEPENQEFRNRVAQTEQIMATIEATKAFVGVAQALEKEGNKDKLKALLSSAPDLIKNNPFVVDLWKTVNPPRDWADNEIALWCGPGFTTWSPKKEQESGESFLGGSEEAVVYLMGELVDLGWKVTVYGDPGEDEGEYDGVTYLPYYKFNAKDHFNILISWRQPGFVDGNYNTKQMYIWCHDIQNQLDYTPERLEKITKIFVLSPWHRLNLKDIPDDKIVISANGIIL